jgi:hypothetical protein
LQSKNYEVFAEADKIPNILHVACVRSHLGKWEKERMSIDLDKYDQYYHHLFLWDENAKKSLESDGLRFSLFSKYGIEGFYLNELFVLNLN